MCGIFGYVGKRNNAAEIVFSGLKTLEYRGYDSWGVAVVYKKNNSNRVFVKKKAGKIGNANISDLPKSQIALGHTRWATHGGVTDLNAHPQIDCTGNISLIHNGIVENYLDLKNRLQSSNHKFSSETDTEIIAHLIEENEKKYDLSEAIRKSFNMLLGRNAIIVLHTKEKSLFVAKNGSPIIIGLGKSENLLASDAAALLPYTNKVIFLEDGCYAKVNQQSVEIFALDTGKKIKPKITTLNWKIEETEKGEYPHFLLKEIFEQGESIIQAINQNNEDLQSFIDLIKKSYGTYFIGCGTAGHACKTASYIFSIIAKRHINYCVGSEFSYLEDFLTTKSLVVAVSQSGETADILEAVKAAKRHNSKVASLVNVVGSSLSRVSDAVLPLRVGPEKSVLSTKAFTGKLAIFYLIAFILAGKHQEGRQKIISTGESISKLLLDEKFHANIKNIADKIYLKQDVYILGRGLNYPIALEAAHKIKEASYIHAEGFAGGEPKHCEISLITQGTPCIIFAPQDETKMAILSNAMELKSRGAYIIGISPTKELVFDDWIRIPDTGVTSAIVEVVPAQLLAYYLAIRRGNDPDKPRNLAKSVTVK